MGLLLWRARHIAWPDGPFPHDPPLRDGFRSACTGDPESDRHMAASRRRCSDLALGTAAEHPLHLSSSAENSQARVAPQGKAGERAQDRDPTLHSDTAVKRRARKNELSMAKPSIPVLSSVCKRGKKDLRADHQNIVSRSDLFFLCLRGKSASWGQPLSTILRHCTTLRQIRYTSCHGMSGSYETCQLCNCTLSPQPFCQATSRAFGFLH